jgi:hypothetical protein
LFHRYEEYLIYPNLADVFCLVSVSVGEEFVVEVLKSKSYIKALVLVKECDDICLKLDHPEFPYDNHPGNTVPIHVLNSFRKQSQGNMLMKIYEKTHGCKYSTVMRLRTDFALFKVSMQLREQYYTAECCARVQFFSTAEHASLSVQS